jgi:hypothetical protein
MIEIGRKADHLHLSYLCRIYVVFDGFYSLVLLQFQVVAVDASRTIARTVMGISSLIFDHVYVVYRGVRLPNVPVLVFRNCILDFRPDRVPQKEGRCMIDNLLRRFA